MSELEVEDVLNPKTIWIEESCFRVNKKKIKTNIRKEIKSPAAAQKPYTDNEELLHCDELVDVDVDVEVNENGRFRTFFRMPHVFYAYVIGTKGSRRKRLEEETKTEIIIPRNDRTNKIYITGPSERSVILCRQRLEMIDIDLRNRHQFTDFISIPLVSPEIKSNFNKFKEAVLSQGHIDGVEESIFQKVDKIHLTIGVLTLLDDSEVDDAKKILNELKIKVIEPLLKSTPPLIIKMKGLEYMNDDPSQVHVLYAKVQIDNHNNQEILQKISDEIVNYFCKKNMMKKEKDNVKLHATLLNTRYRNKNDSNSSRESKMKRISFDARPILKKYSDFYFGEQVLKSIHLSHRFVLDASGYYDSIHTILCEFSGM